MNRITKKKPFGTDTIYVFNRENEIPNFDDGMALLQIVGKYEDLEEELGCPLEIVFKALINGIYTNWDWYYDEFDITAELSHIDNVYYGVNPFGKISIMFGYKKETIIDLKDYKKTWWLREDKSE